MFDALQHSSAHELGQFELDQHRNEEMLALAEQMNNPYRKVAALAKIGMDQVYRGQFLLALDIFQEAMRIEHEMGFPKFLLPWRSLGLPQIDLHTGQYEKSLSWLKAFGTHWYIIVQQMWVSLVRQAYAETLSLAQQAIANLLGTLHKRKGQAEIGTPLALALYELGRKDEARRKLVQYLQTCVEIRAAFIQLMPLIPVIARVLADTDDAQQKERAVELWAMAQNLPFVGNSQLFADLLGKPMAAVAATLPAEVVAAAQARGQELDWWETAAILLDELTEWGWAEEK
jgi:hypothetical protein